MIYFSFFSVYEFPYRAKTTAPAITVMAETMKRPIWNEKKEQIAGEIKFTRAAPLISLNSTTPQKPPIRRAV